MNWLDFRDPVSAWTHGIWFVLAFPATWFLVSRARGDRIKQVGFLIFGLGLAACYGGSTLFHAVRLPADQIEFFGALDHTGIYLLIAGTITPVALVVLEGRWQRGTLIGAWVLATAGSVLCLTYIEIPLALSTGLYLGMGWGVCLSYFVLARVLSYKALRPALIGGMLYSVGALLNVLSWPVFWPGVFAAHELFHLFVMAASVVHYWFMLTVVAPYERQLVVPVPPESMDEDFLPALPSLAVIPLTEPMENRHPSSRPWE